MGNSIVTRDEEFDFAGPKDKSLQIVTELIEKVNANQSDFAEADSKALEMVHSELQRVCNVIMTFLEYSTTIVNDEGGRGLITEAQLPHMDYQHNYYNYI